MKTKKMPHKMPPPRNSNFSNFLSFEMSFFANISSDRVKKLLCNTSCLEKLYNALLNEDDESVVVLTALEMLKKARMVPKICRVFKCDALSLPCRVKGNSCFLDRDYHSALQFYNLAIGSAPKNSQFFLLALSNRSALLQKVKAYSAALKDIEICLGLNCPPNILSKLNLRKEECLRLVSDEKEKKKTFKADVGGKFFNFTDERHPEIPCVTKSVDVIIENEKFKVIAAKEIPAGTIVGLETAFASNLDSMNYYFACHYCHKMVFNLIPCDNCCETLFCSNECKERCNNEYHNIECQLIDVIKDVFPEDCYRIPLKAALKMKYLCKTWEELISCTNKSKTLSINELYDANHVQSVMSITADVNNFVYGQRFNHSFIVAIIIQHLHKIPGFFPLGMELKCQAVRCFIQILMHLIPLHPKYMKMQDAALIYPKMDVTCEPDANAGLFAFACKLTHSCEPNLLVVGHLNKIALISTKNITKGSELTISYVGHWYDQNYDSWRPLTLAHNKPGCQCRVCQERWGRHTLKDAKNKLTSEQKMYVADFVLRCFVKEKEPSTQNDVFDAACRGLAMLQNLPNTEQHYGLYQQFRSALSVRQYLASSNETLHK